MVQQFFTKFKISNSVEIHPLVLKFLHAYKELDRLSKCNKWPAWWKCDYEEHIDKTKTA